MTLKLTCENSVPGAWTTRDRAVERLYWPSEYCQLMYPVLRSSLHVLLGIRHYELRRLHCLRYAQRQCRRGDLGNSGAHLCRGCRACSHSFRSVVSVSARLDITLFDSSFVHRSSQATSANTYAALSMTWLVLVLPSTFAEVIGLSLRRSGPGGYLDVQLFVGSMYIGAFIFGRLQSTNTSPDRTSEITNDLEL